MLTFVFIKTISMVLSGARGIVLARMLGPAEYGIFGTLIAIQQYMSYAALGAREGVAIKLARAQAGDDPGAVYSSSILWGGGVGFTSVVAIAALCATGTIPAHAFWLGLISLCSIVNEILININRHEHRLKKVATIELSYNSLALGLVLALWSYMTVSLALQIVLFSTMLGVTVYLVSLRGAKWASASWRMTRELLRIGILPALFSAVLVAVNSFFVVAAGWKGLGETTGLVVFGNNIATMILFGLNTISWGLASRAMRNLYVQPETGDSQPDLSDLAFRFGVLAAVLIALATQIGFHFVMGEYAGSAVYIFYLCLFQCYGVLLVNEMNFLNVHSRVKPAIAGYVLMLALLSAAAAVADREHFVRVVQLGIALYFVLSMAIAFYCAKLGFRGGSLSHRIVALCFPISCALVYDVAGVVGALVLSGAFILLSSYFHGGRLIGSLAGRIR